MEELTPRQLSLIELDEMSEMFGQTHGRGEADIMEQLTSNIVNRPGGPYIVYDPVANRHFLRDEETARVGYTLEQVESFLGLLGAFNYGNQYLRFNILRGGPPATGRSFIQDEDENEQSTDEDEDPKRIKIEEVFSDDEMKEIDYEMEEMD